MAVLPKKDVLLSIIIINFKTDALVLDLIKNLGLSQNTEIIIVDNSPDDALNSKLPENNSIRYYFMGRNLGFAGGNNFGMHHARGEWIMILNSDTVTSINDILKLLKITITEGYKVSSPKLVNKNGIVQNSVGYFDNLFKNPLNFLLARPRELNCSHTKTNTKVDYAIGAALLMHSTVIQTIGFLDDKNFFMYFEDIDYSYRLHKKHIGILYVPEVKIIHYGGQSADKDQAQKNYNYSDGLNKYVKKHRGTLILALNRVFKLFQ